MSLNMEHSEYLQLQSQLQDHFDGRYVKIEDCEATKQGEADKMDELKKEFTLLREEVRVDRAKTTTRLNILIGILTTIAVPILGLCIDRLF